MRQVILRATNQNDDLEICTNKNGEILYKNISVDKVIEILSGLKPKNTNHKIQLIPDYAIAAGNNYIVIKQPGQKKVVWYEGKAYNINFPNAIYLIEHAYNKIQTVYAYMYIEYIGGETELYEYPLPNELGGNKICMGSANRDIENKDYLMALERIIATQYTHHRFSGIKGFTDTQKWFTYLQENDFPYKLGRKLNKKLEDLTY